MSEVYEKSADGFPIMEPWVTEQEVYRRNLEILQKLLVTPRVKPETIELMCSKIHFFVEKLEA